MLLLFEAQERLEAEFDGFALCLESGSVEDVLHEGIIDDNVGSHRARNQMMCMSRVRNTHRVKKFRRSQSSYALQATHSVTVSTVVIVASLYYLEMSCCPRRLSFFVMPIVPPPT